jgi:hypothetical protein
LRGQALPDGSTRVSNNHYHYTKVEGKWRLTHHLIAEKKLGRLLRSNERVIFRDKNRTNLDPDNLVIFEKGSTTVGRELARLTARRDELEAQIRALQETSNPKSN